jgi:hypothetical protein
MLRDQQNYRFLHLPDKQIPSHQVSSVGIQLQVRRQMFQNFLADRKNKIYKSNVNNLIHPLSIL